MSLRKVHSLSGKVAIITGASRGIGRECALTLARAGCNIVIAAKSTESTDNLPGSIFTVADEVRALGVQALPVQLDVRDENAINKCVESVIEKFGRIDIVINNASALWWKDITETPMKKFDLITSINARGSFALTKACIPHMRKNKFGRVITMSPPISPNGMGGHTAYNISKMGMTMVALGAAAEGGEDNITGNSLWPATVIESYASINFQLGDRAMWRKATILADAVLGICSADHSFTGNMLIDDTYLRQHHGFEDKDFVQYRCDPDHEPPRLLDMEADDQTTRRAFRRGDVKQLDEDKRTSVAVPSKL